MPAPPERPAYLTTNAHAYVKAVFKQLKKTNTLDALAAAGMDQGTVYAYCVEAVLIVQARKPSAKAAWTGGAVGR